MKKFFLVSVLSIFFASLSSAELVSSQKFGYTLDFPEGFVIVDGTDDESMFQFASEVVPVTALLLATEKASGASDFLRDNLKKLGATVQGSGLSEISWRRRGVSVAQFVMQNGVFDERQQGLAVCVPLSSPSSFLSLIVFAPKKSYYQYDCFVNSIIDSLAVDFGGFREVGIATLLKYPQAGKGDLGVKLNIGGVEVSTKIGKGDASANQSVIDREFSVFRNYAMSGDPRVFQYSISAWQRFYRMIAKDSFGRLKKVAQDIGFALSSAAAGKDPENPDAALAQMLLNWSQELAYARQSQSEDRADFNNLPSVLQNLGSDCDSRSMLLAVILKHLGLDTCVFVSPQYSHALLGVVLDGKQGTAFEIDKKKYLLGDTTVKGLTFGKISAEQSNRSAWIEVEFPEAN